MPHHHGRWRLWDKRAVLTADWLLITVGIVQFAVGAYCGYRVGHIHGWKEGYRWNKEKP